MESDEDPILVMARTIYAEMQGSVILNQNIRIRSRWEDLSGTQQRAWQIVAARAHSAYHDRYEYLAAKAWDR